MSKESNDAEKIGRFRRCLLRWGTPPRRSFHWRTERRSPFAVLLTEMLLSRTRAEIVDGIARELLDRYPTPADLAEARREDVEEIIRPLGLFRKRSRLLLSCARQLIERHGGEVPTTTQGLESLPYAGRYVCEAVRCFAFGERVAVVDANVERVYRRVFSLPPRPLHLKDADELWAFATRLLPRRRVPEFTWALLDLGGTVCTARAPACERCPVRHLCDQYSAQRTAR